MEAIKQLITKYNAEEVGGRLIATVNGRREYIANLDNTGFTLTPIGMMLEEQNKSVEKPKRRKRDAVSDDDLSAGLDS